MRQPIVRVNHKGKEVKIFRCEADGGLVLDISESMKLHRGHRIKSPVILTAEEEREFSTR